MELQSVMGPLDWSMSKIGATQVENRLPRLTLNFSR